MVSKRKGPAKLVTPPPSPESDGETILPEELMGEEDDKRCDEEIREEGVEEENPGSKEDEHIKQSEEDRNREAEEIEAESLGNEEEEHINQEEAEGNKESEESDDEQPMEPLGMYFSPSEYCKSIRVGSRCQVKATLAFIQAFDEVQWFEDHSQFRHVFHMPKEENHMSQGFLMLLLHTAKTEMDRECWFVVNGVPIRYSIREHGLLTKFDCNEYPKGYDPSTPVDVKDLEWAIRVFGKATVKIKDVKDKLEIPQSDGDRKKLLILLFLSNVLAAKAKGDGNIDRFLLRMADDVDACEKFPWGRYTFYMCLKGIKTILKCMKGKVEGQKNFGGFITPLEILAFEAIPQLAHRFRERVTAENVCGRMCKSKFKSSLMKGFPLDDINEELGRLKVRE